MPKLGMVITLIADHPHRVQFDPKWEHWGKEILTPEEVQEQDHLAGGEGLQGPGAHLPWNAKVKTELSVRNNEKRTEKKNQSSSHHHEAGERLDNIQAVSRLPFRCGFCCNAIMQQRQQQ